MYAIDLSLYLDPHDKQIFDTLARKAAERMREQQRAEAMDMARRPVRKRSGDRMRVG